MAHPPFHFSALEFNHRDSLVFAFELRLVTLLARQSLAIRKLSVMLLKLKKLPALFIFDLLFHHSFCLIIFFQRSQSHRDSLFKETHEQNAFQSYASHKYYRQQPHDMLVGIKRNGQIKRATKTLHGQTATQFVVIKF